MATTATETPSSKLGPDERDRAVEALKTEELDILVITTASDDHGAVEVAPDSGRLFTVRPGVRGVPSARVAASVCTLS